MIIGAFLVKSMPLGMLRWWSLVLYAAVVMLVPRSRTIAPSCLPRSVQISMRALRRIRDLLRTRLIEADPRALAPAQPLKIASPFSR